MADDRSGIPKHPLVEVLRPETDGERRVALVGYPGASNQPNKIRLYPDLTFKTYLEIPSEAAIRSVPTKAGDENAPIILIVDAKAQVDRVTSERTSGDAAYLSGGISNAHYGAAQTVSGTGGAHAECICVTFSVVGTFGAEAAAQCICVTFSAVNTIGREAANAAGAGASGLGCTTVTVPPTHLLGCTTVTAPTGTFFCPPAAPNAMGAGTVHTIFNCHPVFTMGVTCTFTAGPNCAPAQAGAPQHYGAAPCHNITHTLATTCTMPVPGGAAQPNLGALGCLNLANTTVCTPTGVPILCPA